MKIKEIIAKVNKWHSYAQIRFLDKIADLITIATRDILGNKETSSNDKLDAIGWNNLSIKNNTGECSCSYQITEIQNNKLYSVLGVDGLQSFQLALKIIHSLLNSYNIENDNQIVWLDKEFDLIKE